MVPHGEAPLLPPAVHSWGCCCCVMATEWHGAGWEVEAQPKPCARQQQCSVQSDTEGKGAQLPELVPRVTAGRLHTAAAKPLCLHPALHFSPFLIRIIVMSTGKILQNRAVCCCQRIFAANIYFSTIIVGAVGPSFRDGADEGAAHAVPVPG